MHTLLGSRRAFVLLANAQARERGRDIFRQEVNRQLQNARSGLSFCNKRMFLFWGSWCERKTPRTTDAGASNSFLPSPFSALPYFQSPVQNVIFLRFLDTLHCAFSLAQAKCTKCHLFRVRTSVMYFSFLTQFPYTVANRLKILNAPQLHRGSFRLKIFFSLYESTK